MRNLTTELDRLAAFIRRKPATAREIATELKCAMPTAYLRIKALIDRGDPVLVITSRRKRPGPAPAQYSLPT